MLKNIHQKVQYVLTQKQRKELLLIFSLVLIGVFFEILGIGMIIPVINIIVEEDIQSKFPYLISILEFLGFPEKKQLILYSLIFLLFIYGIKNIFLAYLTWKKGNFTFNLYADISKRLLNVYLNQNFSFHLNKWDINYDHLIYI